GEARATSGEGTGEARAEVGRALPSGWMGRMRIGAVFPQLEIGNDPATIARWATEVERMGFRHILAFDHVIGAGTDTRPGWRGYTSDSAFHEVFVLFGYLAALTTDMELVTGVLVLP